MKNRDIKIILALFFLSVFQLSAQNKPVAVIKLYKTEEILLKDVDKRVELFEAQAGRTLTKDEKRQLLDSMIHELLILQDAAEEGITANRAQIEEAAKQQLSQQLGTAITVEQMRTLVEQQLGVTYSFYLDQMKRQFILQQYVASKKGDLLEQAGGPTEREIKRYFHENQTVFINPELVRFSHIYFDTRKKAGSERTEARRKADDALLKIRNGSVTFEELVRTTSEDPVSQQKNGDVGFVARNDKASIELFGENFFDAIFALSPGQISGVVASNAGYHIVKVTEKQPRKFLELDDPISPADSTTVTEYINQILSMQKQQETLQIALDQVIDELIDIADIKVYNENFSW